MKKIISMIIAMAMVMCMAGCTNAAEKAAEQARLEAEALAEQERLEAEAEAARLEEERIAAEKAEEERLEQERLEAEAAEAARVEELRTQITRIIEEDVPVLMEEMTENFNQDGLTALTTLVDEYDDQTSDVDEFIAEYEQIVADKEAYDAAWEEFPYVVTALDETIRYAAQSVNIRSLPSEEGEVLGSFNTNDEITVVGESGDWYQIRYNDADAYVYKALTSENIVEVAPPAPAGIDVSNYTLNTWLTGADGAGYAYFLLPFGDYITNFNVRGWQEAHTSLLNCRPHPGCFVAVNLVGATTDGNYLYITQEVLQ